MLKIVTTTEKLVAGSDAMFVIKRIEWQTGLESVKFEFPMVNTAEVNDAFKKQTTGVSEKKGSVREWLDYQWHVGLFLDTVENFIAHSSSYNSIIKDLTGEDGKLDLTNTIVTDAKALVVKQGELSKSLGLVLHLQAFPESEYNFTNEPVAQVIEGRYLVVDVELLDGTVVKKCSVFSADVRGTECASNTDEVKEMFKVYPWGNNVREIHLQGLTTRVQITVTPNEVKDVKIYWVNAKGEVIKGAESRLC
ncbi:hypothetical protein [Bacillus sp. NEAU-Y102]